MPIDNAALAAKTAVLIPTRNAGAAWREALEALQSQTLKPARVLIVDSSSTDDTVKIAREYGYEVESIDVATFDHGGTRQMMADRVAPLPYLVFLTQDAILNSTDALENLVRYLDADPKIGAVCGRQLPHLDATPIAAHHRLFNYRAHNYTKTAEDALHYGLKVAYMSNSFGVYRREAFEAVGGFPTRSIFGEDMLAVGRMLELGWKNGYCADAAVRHSHNYTFQEEFRRSFDIGVMHAHNKWLLTAFGRAEWEGLRFVQSELKYLLKHEPLDIPSAVMRTALKLVGYRLGKYWHRWPRRFVLRCSMHRKWWANQTQE
jgi:rhamnosyltransferase